jgi:Asp-tRNA(Asn)/Glu-tRNA(Gln) amidotransferase A subunit family amidase
MQGVLPLSANLDSIGPLAPSVRCCAALDAVLSGQSHGELRAASLQGLRLLAPTNVVLDGMDSAVAAAWQRALSLLYAAGVQITEAVVPPFSELAQINAKGGFTPPRPGPGTAAISTAPAAWPNTIRAWARAFCAARTSARPTISSCWRAASSGLPASRRRWPITT